MESSLFLLMPVSICICTAIVLMIIFTKTTNRKLPPGPSFLTVLADPLWLLNSLRSLRHMVHEFHKRYGPIITFRISSHVSIFVSDCHLAHKMLIQNGATFASRPPPFSALMSLMNNNYHSNINGAPYGPVWRLLRRNLMTETFHPSNIRLFAPARSWALSLLTSKLLKESEDGRLSLEVTESFQFAMYSLISAMCFGERLDEESVNAIVVAQNNLLVYSNKISIHIFAPSFIKKMYNSRLKTARELQQKLKEIYVPLINKTREYKEKKEEGGEGRYMHSYVESLLGVKDLEDGGINLTEDDIASLSSEFLGAGVDTTATALMWVMAELVEHQEIQMKLFDEIKEVVGENIEEKIKEDDLHKFSYLKAVVYEALRLHPPGHFTLPHTVTEETVIDGYTIPKNSFINFGVAEIGMDEKIWPNPTEFKPERFLHGGEGEGVDLKGSREIKMMPFGVGRRICPALSLALLHLMYFVGNLVKEFEWKSVDGENVDFTEKQEFTVIMANPLKLMVIPRKIVAKY